MNPITAKQLAFYIRQVMSQEFHIELGRRWELMRRIEECKTERGTVYLVESGMDCDGSQYSGAYLGEVDANWMAVYREYNTRCEWAEGPFSLSVVSEEELKTIRHVSRDLALEAFEDGHPHVLYPH